MSHVILTGFMAVGKTAVGKRLARRLGRPFVDTDHLIEVREGVTISQIFASRGEAEFRRIERDVVENLAGHAPAVIATGGGTFVDETNRALLKSLGIVVCLVTSIETILDRAGRSNKRPLAAGADPNRLARLYEERMPAYRQADILIETDGLTVEQSVVRVLNMIEPRLKTEPATGEGAA